MNRLGNKITETQPKKWFYWGIIALVTIAHILIYSIMPYSCDDYWYMTPIRDYCMGVDTSFPMQGLWDCWQYHYQSDNIRLSNVVFTLFLLLPKVVPSIISGLLVGVMLWLSTRLIGISWRNPVLLSMLVFMLSFMLPWYEEMFTLCFAFNYVWATAIALLIAKIYWSDKRYNIVLLFVLGLIMGAWHEGFSAPLLVGFLTYIALRRGECNSQRIAIMLGMVIGLLWLFSAPGLQANVDYKTTSLNVGAIVRKLMIYHTPMLIALMSIIVALFKRSTRKLILDPLFVSFMMICVSGSALNFITNVGVRTGWIGYLFGIISTLYLWKGIKNTKYSKAWSSVKSLFAIVMTLFLLVHYVVVVYYTCELKKEYACVLEEYEKSDDGLVFADVTYDYEVLPVAWKKPYFETFTYKLITYWIDEYYGEGKELRVIPTCLRNADELKAQKVVGDNPFWVYEGHFFAPIPEGVDVGVEKEYEIDFGFTKKRIICSNFIFTTQSGRNYYFVFPQRITISNWFGDIESINEVQ